MQIVIDSCSDVEYVDSKKLNVHYVPITVNLNNKEYLDGIELNKDDFYKLLVDEGLYPKTSQPSPQAFIEIFQEAKKKNEDVICLLLSSKLSGTVRSAQMAKEIVDYERIYIIDTLSVSVPIKFLLDEVLKNKDKMSVSELVSYIESLKEKLVIIAGLDTLEYLHKGGRLSRGKMLLGNILNMKPIITVINGAVEPCGKAIGITRAYETIRKYIAKHPIDEKYPIYFGYTMNQERMQGLMKKLSLTGETLQIGTAIGTHVGPNCYAIFYVKK